MSISELMSDPAVMAADTDNWTRLALCAGDPDPDCWFSTSQKKTNRAIAKCRACPVQNECLRFAINTRQSQGVWGGTTPQERRLIRQHRAQRPFDQPRSFA
jgi:WhiB family transcriptional regulator, redox-sensing transcriptional regulator